MLSQAIPVRQVKNNSKETAHWRNIAMEFMQHFHGEVNQNITPLVHLPCMCLNTCFSWSRYACTQVLSSLCFMDNRYCLSASKRIKYSQKPDISTTYISWDYRNVRTHNDDSKISLCHIFLRRTSRVERKNSLLPLEHVISW